MKEMEEDELPKSKKCRKMSYLGPLCEGSGEWDAWENGIGKKMSLCVKRENLF